jgi:hypothetical protein
MSRLAALHDLCAALRGTPKPASDWAQVLNLANVALVTPQLEAAAGDQAPDELRPFMREVRLRNRERNRRLHLQLTDAVRALNAVGIEPTLLKGAALWASVRPLETSDRMMNDLDVLVRPAEVPRALEALSAAGLNLVNRYDGPEVHVVAEFGRPQDVGFLDLHQRAPGPPGLAEFEELESLSTPVTWEGVTARVPPPAVQLFLMVLHDQFHDGDYWRGGFTLRHLFDIADLASGPMDWDLVRSLCRTALVRHALDAQLLAAHRLAGAVVPPRVRRSAWARLQHARHLAQYRWPQAAAALATIGAFSETPAILAHRKADAADRRRLFGAGHETSVHGLSERIGRLRHIMGDFATGKI